MQPQEPKISVVMPVRNGGRFVDAAIGSVRNQSFGGFEFLIIDDGSTDGTAEMVQRHQREDARIRTFETGGAGIVAALNLGIAEARGGFIARMDADDLARPMRFALQLAFLEANPLCLACGTDVELMDETGRQIIRSEPFQSGPIGTADLLRDNPLIHPTMMIRRDALILAGGYRTGCTYAEDYDLWLRLCEQGPLANLPDKALQLRRHSGQTSSTKRLAQRAAAALARQVAIGRSNGTGEGADLSNELNEAVRQYVEMRHGSPEPIKPFEAKDLLVMARYAQLQAGGRWISGIEWRIKRETGLRKAWLMPVWYFLDRSKA